MSDIAHINRIGTAVPPNDFHHGFLGIGRRMLRDARKIRLFDRMAERSGIAHRFSVMGTGRLDAGEIDNAGFYRPGSFPGTGARMAFYDRAALPLARQAVAALGLDDKPDISHLIVASCTGFAAPGLDLQLAAALGLPGTVERTLIGFMGCSAALPALRAARHIVRSDVTARVLVVNLELCSLHLHETSELDEILAFLLWGDGCSAALVTAQPEGIALQGFRSAVIPDSSDLITWQIGDDGFRMHLSGQVPQRISEALRDTVGQADAEGLLYGKGTQSIDLWAVHTGGRTVLDAVESSLSLPPEALSYSRGVLHDYGNMSSATVMFVLERMLQRAAAPACGIAMAFGPGMVAESMQFRLAA